MEIDSILLQKEWPKFIQIHRIKSFYYLFKKIINFYKIDSVDMSL